MLLVCFFYVVFSVGMYMVVNVLFGLLCIWLVIIIVMD